MRHLTRAIALLAAAAFMVACGESLTPSSAPQFTQPQHQAEAPVPAQPAPSQPAPQAEGGINWGSMAIGAVGGYLLGNALQPSAPPQQAQQTRVVRETRYIERAPSPAAAPVAKPAAPAFTAPAFTAPRAPKPATPVVPKFSPPPPAPTKYGGPSGYSSVRQATPSYSFKPSRK